MEILLALGDEGEVAASPSIKCGRKQMKEMWGDGKHWKTKAAFFSWLRGGLRRAAWMKHPVKLELLRELRYKSPIGKGGKDVWAVDCAMCGEQKRQSECQVDHIHAAGKLNDVEDIQGFVERLAFVSSEDLRIICRECHGVVTYMERYGVDMETAKMRKEAIRRRKHGR